MCFGCSKAGKGLCQGTIVSVTAGNARYHCHEMGCLEVKWELFQVKSGAQPHKQIMNMFIFTDELFQN